MCDWAGCDCVLLDHPIENCKACGHPRISHYIYFTRFIANPIKRYPFGAVLYQTMEFPSATASMRLKERRGWSCSGRGFSSVSC